MIKPDGVKRGLAGEVIKRFESVGLRIEKMRLEQLSKEIVEENYAEHRGKPFFGGVVRYVTSGPVVLMVVTGAGAVKIVRKLMGATDPCEAAPGTIRGDFALDISANVIHGSDSPESATREIALFFGGREA
ncbi:MAG: nucleoside-diphosphate kinase [Actinobacteria bacterium]|nr:MAG: nucleoside-diphosphate kinase [Actinomycetota bacterium]